MSGTVQTVGPVYFDYKWWAIRYPDLAEWCSAGQAQGYFDIATLYCDNTDNGTPTPAMCDLWMALGMLGYPPIGGPIQNISRRQILLGLLTAHVAALNAPIDGNPPRSLVGRISNASEGSISVAVDYPQNPNEAWFNQTKHGAAFLKATGQYRFPQYFPGPGALRDRWPFGQFS
jgi:hypothetical protein